MDCSPAALSARDGWRSPSGSPTRSFASRGSPEDRDLEGETVLITAGPTQEPLDPVRFISNRSSGKMGYAIAEAAAARGAHVVLVSGPVACLSRRSATWFTSRRRGRCATPCWSI